MRKLAHAVAEADDAMLQDALLHRQICRDLADQLVVEYAGALPPGQVIAAVIRTGRVLGSLDADPERWGGMCEALVRRGLAARVAGVRSRT